MDLTMIAAAVTKAAVAGLAGGPVKGGTSAVTQAVDLVASWLREAPARTVETVLEEATAAVVAFAQGEGVPEAYVTPALLTARDILTAHSPSAAEAIELDLDVEAVTTAFLGRAGSTFTTLDEPAQPICPSTVRIVFSTFLMDPTAVPEIETEFRRAVLTRLRELAQLPTEVLDALRGHIAPHVLDARRRRWNTKLSPPSALLRAEYEIVPFYGRSEDLDDLGAWASGNGPGIRLITGRGGMGKTRLMIEWCRRLATRGWAAGFIDYNADPGIWTSAANALFGNDQPLAIVIDYAETRRELVLSVLRQARNRNRSTPTRVVLLARERGDWWTSLLAEGDGLGELLRSDATSRVLLSAVAPTLSARRDLFDTALTAFGAHLAEAAAKPVAPDLSTSAYDRALFVLLAALAAARGEEPQRAEALLDEALYREYRFLDAGITAAGLPSLAGTPIQQCAAVASLIEPAQTRSRAVQVLSATVRWPGGLAPDYATVHAVVELLARLYPGSAYMQGVQPDLLGEHLGARALDDDPDMFDGLWDVE